MNVDPRFAAFPLRIGPSAVDRRGVFAEARIPARRKVIEYTGEKITRPQGWRRLRRILCGKGPKRMYISKINRKWSVDGAVGGSGAEYVNHCCDPNLFKRKANGRIYYYSRKPIRKGQELTVDYRFGPTKRPLACHCGSRKCRGTINLTK
jgi:SET domain-containing protein